MKLFKSIFSIFFLTFSALFFAFSINTFLINSFSPVDEKGNIFTNPEDTPTPLEYLNPQLSLPSDYVSVYKNSENRTSDKAFDFVFYNNGYTNQATFVTAVKNFATAIKSFNFFNTNLGRFNIGYVSAPLDKARYLCNEYQCTNEVELNALSKQYGDVAIIISNSDTFSGWSFFKSTWPNYLGYVNISRGVLKYYPTSSLMHELGHSLGKLNDEYIYTPEPSPMSDGVNCKSTCAKLGTSTCYQGCVSGSYFRTSKDSIMKNPASTYYDQIALNQLNTTFSLYAPKMYTGATPFLISPNVTTLKTAFDITWISEDSRPHLIWIGNSTSSNSYYSTDVIYSGGSKSVDLTKTRARLSGYLYIRLWTWDSPSGKWLYVDKKVYSSFP